MPDPQSIDPQSLPLLTQYYKLDPSRFTAEQAQNLQSQAKDAGYNFELAPQHKPSATIGSIFQQFGTGFIQGFTTIPIGEAPQNSTEAIVHSIGEIAGLVGFIPNPAGWGVKGGSWAVRLAGDAAAKRLLPPLFLHLGSPVTHVAGWMEKGIERSVLNAPVFKGMALLEGTSRHVIEGSLRMGLIGAVSARPFYQLDIADRVNGFLSMAPMGAINGFLGIQVNKYGKWDVGKALGLADRDQAQLVNNVARAMASGIAMGLPGTLRGDPAEMQIYEYLLMGYFGYKEPSLVAKQTLDFMNPVFARGEQHLLTDPTKLPGFTELSPDVQEEVRYESRQRVGRRLQPQWLIADARLSDLYKKVVKDKIDPMIYFRTGILTEPEARGMKAVQELNGTYEDFLKVAKHDNLPDPELYALDETGKALAKTMSMNEQDYLESLLSGGNLSKEDLSNAMVMQHITDYTEQAQVPHTFIENLYKLTGSKTFSESETVVKQVVDIAAKNRGQSFDTFVTDITKAFPDTAKDEDTLLALRRQWWRADAEQPLPQMVFNETKGLQEQGTRDRTGKFIAKWGATTPVGELLDRRETLVSTYESVVDGKVKTVPLFEADVPLSKIIAKIQEQGWRLVGLVKEKGAIRIQRPVLQMNQYQTVDGKPEGVKVTGNKRVWDVVDEKGKPTGGIWVEDNDLAQVGDPNWLANRATLRARHLKQAGQGGIDYWDTPPDPNKVGIIGVNYDDAKEDGYDGVSVRGSLADSKVRRQIERAVKNNMPFYFSQLDKVNPELLKYITERGGDIVTDPKFDTGLNVMPDSFTASWMSEAWDNNFAHLLYAYQKLNGMMPLDKLLGGGEGFLKGARKAVQRAQLTFTGDIHVHADEVATKLKTDKLRVALVKFNKNDHNTHYQYVDRETGDAMDTTTDGVFSLRSDIFDALVDDVGLSKLGGSAKGSIVDSSDPEKGVLIGKLLYHRASPELEKFLVENNLHGEMWTTSAKAYGSRVPLTPAPVDGKYGYSGITTEENYLPSEGRFAGTNVIYHGTNVDVAKFVDASGNLHLKPSSNFGGRTVGVSFTDDIKNATDYAERIKESGGRKHANATLLSIDRGVLPSLEPEAMGEFFANTPKEIVVPKGSWGYEYLFPKERAEYQKWISDEQKQVQGISNGELLERAFQDSDRSELREYNRENEDFDKWDHAGDTLVNNALVADFGSYLDDPFVWSELERRGLGDFYKKYYQVGIVSDEQSMEEILKNLAELPTPPSIDPYISVDLKSIRMNPTWGEDPVHALEPVDAVLQLHGNLTGKALSDFINEYSIPSRRGTSQGNGRHRRAWEQQDSPAKQEVAIKNLNVDDVSLDDVTVKLKTGGFRTYPGIISILKRGPMQDTPLYRHIAKKVLKLDERLKRPEGNVGQEEIDNFNEIQSLQSSVRGILKIVGIHPGSLNLISTVSRYQDMMLIDYVKSRIQNPRLFGSTKAVIYGQDIPELLARGTLKEGTYMASAGYKNWMVEWPGAKNKVTLSYAYSQYLKAVTDGTVTIDQEKAMRHLLGRVPADSASGWRVLKFAGFTERPGFGMYIHPEDYRAMGGADNDGDTIFAYTKIIDSVKDYYSQDSVRDQWYSFTSPRKPLLKQEVLSSEEFYSLPLSEQIGYTRRFIPTDQHPELVAKLTKGQEELYNTNASMFDVLSLAEVNKGNFLSNANLGLGMASKIAMKTALMKAGAPQQVIDALEEFGRENVNKAADAPKYDPMVSRGELSNLYEKFANGNQGVLDDYEKIREAQRIWANGKDKMGNRLSFHVWLRELNDRIPYDAAKGYEPHSYSAMQSLAGQLYKPSQPFSAFGWTRIMKTKDDVGRILGANTRGGVFARRLLGLMDFSFPMGENWTKSPRFLYRFFDAKGNEVDAKEALQTSPDGQFTKDKNDNFVRRPGYIESDRGNDEQNELANQLLGQDYMDAATYLRCVRIAQEKVIKDMNVKEVEFKHRVRQVMAVITKSNEFKQMDVERIRAMWEGQDIVTSLDEMTKETLSYRNKLTEPLRELFDTWYLGSLRQQELPLKEVLANAEKQRISLQGKLDAMTAVPGFDVKEVQKLKNALFLNSDYQVEKRWRSSNLGGSQWLYSWISDVAKKGLMDEFAGLTTPSSYNKDALTRVHEVVDDKWSDVERASRKIEGTEKNPGTPVTEMNGIVVVEKALKPIKTKLQELVQLSSLGGKKWEDNPEKQKEMDKLQTDLRELIYKEPSLGKFFDELFAGTVASRRWSNIGRAPEVATLEDVREFIDAFKIKGHFWHDLQNMPEAEARKKLRWYHFFGFPDWVAESILAKDHTVITNKEGLVVTKDGTMMQPIKYFQSHLGQLVEFGKMSHRATDAAIDVWHRQIKDEFQVVDNLNSDYVGEKIGTRLMELAATRIELDRLHESDAAKAQLAKEWRDKTDEYNKLKDRVLWMKDVAGKRIPLTGEQVITELEGKIRSTMKRGRLLMYNPDAEKLYIKETNGEIDVQETLKAIQEAMSGGTMEYMGENGIRRIAHQFMTNRFIADYQLRKEAGTTNAEQTKYLMDSFPGLKPEHFTLTAGRVVFRPMGELPAAVRGLLKKKLLEFSDGTGKSPFEWLTYTPKDLHDVNNYFPHLLHDRAQANKYLEDRIKELGFTDAVDPNLSRVQLETIMEYAKSHSPTGGDDEAFNAMLNDVGMTPELKTPNLTVPEALDASHQIPDYFDLSSSKGRATSNLGVMPGWEKTVNALEFYGRQKIQGYHNMLYTMISNHVITHFEDKKPLGEDTEAWASFMKLYSRQVVGQPSLIPDAFLKDKNFKSAINPYKYFSDQYWLERIRQINKKLDLKPGAEITMKDIKNVGQDQVILRKITSVSNLEAKWELLSLLSHTKTMVNNLMGGNTNVAIEVGFQPLRDAWSLSAIQRKMRSVVIDGKEKEIKSLQDVWDFAGEYGGMEAFVARQIDWNPELQTQSWASATKEMLELAKAKGFKGLTAEQLGALAKKHGIMDSVMSKAAWFMRVTEVSNRRRAWVAGYLKAQQLLEGGSYSYKPDDPWLIHMANRTVEATQFLYNNASRPMFAATNIGKIFTRFQLYAYNSLAFRGNILRMAKQTGYVEGSEEMDRFKRMAGIDLFVLAMATMFPASLFDANLMQPWQTFQGVAEMLFGSDEDKRKAFYGTLPYPANIIQPISPPITRAFYPIFTGLLTGEWDKWSSYTAWTLAPFGRLAKGARTSIDNPTMIMENFLGLPVHQMAKVKMQAKKTQVTQPIKGLLGSVWSGF